MPGSSGRLFVLIKWNLYGLGGGWYSVPSFGNGHSLLSKSSFSRCAFGTRSILRFCKKMHSRFSRHGDIEIAVVVQVLNDKLRACAGRSIDGNRITRELRRLPIDFVVIEHQR